MHMLSNMIWVKKLYATFQPAKQNIDGFTFPYFRINNQSTIIQNPLISIFEINLQMCSLIHYNTARNLDCVFMPSFMSHHFVYM